MKYNTETFIDKARRVHNDKYNYSKVEYVNSKTKVCIICPKHGEFWQMPHDHLNHRGCSKCTNKKRLSTEEFIKRAREIHGNKYDYSKVEYKNSTTKVCIICPIHGEFWIYPLHHINKGRNQRGCPKCGDIKRRQNTRKNTKWFVEKAKELYGDKYDYSKANYIHSMSGICITCLIHGDFWTTPNRFLNGHGCPKCVGLNKTTEEFIEAAKQLHGDKYDYSKVDYQGSTTKVTIICPKHGEFLQLPTHHLQGRGCPHCRQSSLEKEVREFLIKEGIKFIAQKRIKWLNKQSLDFYLPKYHIAIECQGLQHFRASDYFGGEKRYKRTVELDDNKYKLCKEHGINILYYTHYNLPYEYELIDNLITLKSKIYENLSKN